MRRKSPSAEVSPAVMRWARESAGVDTAMAARKVGVKPETVQKWESGASNPTLGALEDLAALYRRPLAAFFLPCPPADPPLPHDFRVLPGGEAVPLSRASRLAIREARRVQAIATELTQGLGRNVPSRLGRAGVDSDPEELASKERQRLGIGVEEQLRWPTPNAALREWRRAVERQGILTLQFAMPIEEARGLCLPDGGMPVIVLNSSDAVNGRVFTLFHEYAHVLLDSAAICMPELGWHGGGAHGRTERFCNRFAAALLVPRRPLAQEHGAQSARLPGGLSDQLVTRLSARFKVSRHVVLLRLRDVRAATDEQIRPLLEQLEPPERPTRPKRRGGAPPARRCLQERGAYFAGLVLEAQARDLITHSDVADYLSLQLRHVDEVESLLGG